MWINDSHRIEKDDHSKMNIVLYKNIIFYNGKFYTNKENIKTCSLHSKNINIFSPLDIKNIKLNDTPKLFNKGILLLESFHWNPAHMMWDFMYPSWYGLYINNTKYSKDIDFQWITSLDIEDIHVHTYKHIAEKISGSCIETLKSFSNKYNEPLLIPWLITGLYDIGISHVNKNNLIVKRGIDINNIDPIELFVNRIYSRYNIKRNSLIDKLNINECNNIISLVDKLNINECNNIIFIKNKRPYNGIEKLFKKMNDKYKGKYNFKIIDYSKYNFEQQLYILNTTCLCIVGVGSARFNTPFLPNGAIEIQIFQPNIHKTNNIEYLDYHAGTLSKYVKIKNIPYYTKEEANNNLYSHLLENYIDDSLIEIPCIVPINLEENIPVEIKNLKYHKNYNEKFDIWRNNNSNIVEDLINLL